MRNVRGPEKYTSTSTKGLEIYRPFPADCCTTNKDSRFCQPVHLHVLLCAHTAS